MSLTIRHLLNLQSLSKLKLLAGHAGLDRHVTSVGIVDYEFYKPLNFPNESAFDENSFNLSSLLFAIDHPENILEAIKTLKKANTAAFAFKNVIYTSVPDEVITYCNTHAFPLFSFEHPIYFENIIFEIMDAIHKDDTSFLNEETIHAMIHGHLNSSQVYQIAKNISLYFKGNILVAYIHSQDIQFQNNLDKYYRNFYLNRHLNQSVLLSKYQNGLFAIITIPTQKYTSLQHQVTSILDNLISFFEIPKDQLEIYQSSIYTSLNDFNLCFSECYHTYLVSKYLNIPYTNYQQLGINQFLITNHTHPSLIHFTQQIVDSIKQHPVLFDTAITLTHCQGDLYAVSQILDCHPNTIRYRIEKLKQLTNMEQFSDYEFYSQLSIAIKTHLIKSGINSSDIS